MNQNLRSSSLNFMRLTEFQYIPFFEVFFFLILSSLSDSFSTRLFLLFHPFLFLFLHFFRLFSANQLHSELANLSLLLRLKIAIQKFLLADSSSILKINTLHSINAL